MSRPSPASALGPLALLATLVVLVLLSVGRCASGHEPDEPNAEWYNGLTNDAGGNAIGCCGAHHDCRALGSDDYRASETPGYAYDVRIDGRWVPVVDGSVLRHTTNPTGRPVACWGYVDWDKRTPWVRCLVLPAEG